MKGYSKYIKFAVTFILTLIPALVLADSNLTDGFMSELQKMSFTPPAGDMSVSYLSKIFGAVPGVPQLKGTSILGTLFAVFNAGILGLSGVFLAYTITKIVTETTMDGAAMGKSTTVWTSIRCALSTSLLVPQVSGYSMINGIVMWIVIQSVGLADLTWNKAMDYLKKGGGIYATTTAPTATVDYSLIAWGEKTGNPNIDNTNIATSVGSTDVLRSLVCAHTIHNALLKSQQTEKQRLADKKAANGFLSSEDQIQYNNSTQTIPEKSDLFTIYKDLGEAGNGNGTPYVVQFPYIKNEAKDNPLANYGLSLAANDIPKNLTGLCGTIGYDVPVGAGGDDYTIRAENYRTQKFQGLENMISILDPIAKQLVTKAQEDANGNVQLDTNKYELYKDGKRSISFVNDPTKTPDLLNQTYYTDTRFKNAEVSKLSTLGINWPQGVNEILTAAAQYQIILAPAQAKGKQRVVESTNTAFDEAKKFGWIGAGGYYRLLSNIQKAINMEYDSYRLMGYKDPTTLLDDKKDKRDQYQNLFKGATDIQVPSGKTYIGMLDSDAEKTLARAFNWIFLSYPYAKLYGMLSSPDLANIAFGPGFAPYSFFWTSEVGIDVMFSFGLVSIIAFPPAAIPLLMNVPTYWLEYDIYEMSRVWDYAVNYRPDMDPILKLQVIGEAMMKCGMTYLDQVKIFFVLISVATSVSELIGMAASTVAAICTFMGICIGAQEVVSAANAVKSDVLAMVQTIVYINLPIGMAIVTPLLVSGAMLAIYLPLVPYLLFLFGIMSWFISVLVIMAAAPIICFMMLWGNSSQENPLLAREAEQFIMQLLAVFFRPTLMIVGLVAGMLLSYVGVDVLNLGFVHIAQSTVLNGLGGSTLGMIKYVGMMIIYTFTMVSLVNMCFSTIYLLYSETIRVLGVTAPATGLEEKQLEAVKAGFSSFAEAGASGMKAHAEGMKGVGTYKDTASEKIAKALSKGEGSGGAGASGGGKSK